MNLSSDVLSEIIIQCNTLSITKLFHSISYSKFVLSRVISFNDLYPNIKRLNLNVICERFPHPELFLESSRNGDLDMMKFLIGKINDKYLQVALIISAHEGYLDIVEYLLQKGIFHSSAYDYALNNNKSHVVDFLQKFKFCCHLESDFNLMFTAHKWLLYHHVYGENIDILGGKIEISDLICIG